MKEGFVAAVLRVSGCPRATIRDLEQTAEANMSTNLGHAERLKLTAVLATSLDFRSEPDRWRLVDAGLWGMPCSTRADASCSAEQPVSRPLRGS